MITISELADKYPLLDHDDLLDGVEASAIDLFQSTHNCPVTAVVDEQDGLSITLLRDDHETIHVTKLKRRMLRRLIDRIELELMERQVFAEATMKLRGLTGGSVTGEILRVLPNGTHLVQIDLSNGTQRTYIAECPVAEQPYHERGKHRKGVFLTYLVSEVRAVRNDRHAKVRITLSRIAKDLPARMLTTLSRLPGIHCLKRELRPGRYRHSIVVSPLSIKWEHVAVVGRELCEHIEIIVPEKRSDKPKHSAGPEKRKAKWIKKQKEKRQKIKEPHVERASRS